MAQPARIVLPSRPLSRWGRFQAFRERHQKKEIAVFLGGGFLFDVLTLGRIDDWMTLLQQAGYLGLLGFLLAVDERVRLEPESRPNWMSRIWGFQEDAVHFLFGCLLSLYAIFYFKSASGILSLAFLVFLFGLLVANELPRFRHLGPTIRVALYSFCLTSFLAYLIPVLVGSIGLLQFAAAVSLALLPAIQLFRMILRWSGSVQLAMVRALVPALAVQGSLFGLYMVGAIPPVPLSVQEIGVYHGVDHSGDTWRMTYREPEYFWQQGNRHFSARPGDKVYCFTRIFAPNRFKDKVNLRWWLHDAKRGWTLQDTIPLVVVGGRAGGFRGFAYKAHYQPGKWKISAETLDGRVIGTLRFRIDEDIGTDDRLMMVDYAGPRAGPFVGAAVLTPQGGEADPLPTISDDTPQDGADTAAPGVSPEEGDAQEGGDTPVIPRETAEPEETPGDGGKDGDDAGAAPREAEPVVTPADPAPESE